MAGLMSLGVKITLALLMIVSIIELSFISSMVAWLHFTASGTFAVNSSAGTFDLQGKPLDLMVNQGHTSNGAAGTAFVLIGCGGILALWVRRSPSPTSASGPDRIRSAVYQLWIAFNIPALLLTLGALVYVFVVTSAHSGQAIDVDLAARLKDGEKYPLETWTPQNWFAAVLGLDLAEENVRADINSHHMVMVGWQYNLIPMFLVQLAQTAFAMVEFVAWRREADYNRHGHGQWKA